MGKVFGTVRTTVMFLVLLGLTYALANRVEADRLAAISAAIGAAGAFGVLLHVLPPLRGVRATGTITALNPHRVKLHDRPNRTRHLPVVEFTLGEGTTYTSELQTPAPPEQQLGSSIALVYPRGAHQDWRPAAVDPVRVILALGGIGAALVFGFVTAGPGFAGVAVVAAVLAAEGSGKRSDPIANEVVASTDDPLPQGGLPDLRGPSLSRNI